MAAALITALAVACLGLLAAAAEAWAAAATLPRWAPAPPYWVRRVLATAPFADAAAWTWVRYKLGRASLRPSGAPPWSDGFGLDDDRLTAGSYQGWTDGADGGLTLRGHACTPADPLVALGFTTAGATVEVGREALTTLEDDLGTGYSIPVTRIAAPLPVGDYGRTLQARCRSGAEERLQVGALRVVAVPPNPGNLQVHYRAVGAYTELLVVNPGPATLTLRAVEYAPAMAATGLVSVGGSPGTPAARLDVALRPSTPALVTIGAPSLHATRPPLPAFFHPLIRYELEDGTWGGALVTDAVAVAWTGD